MKLLVVGAGGQVGERLAREAVDRGHTVVGTYRSRPPRVKMEAAVVLDKTDASSVAEVFSKFRPDAVVDTGALHNVDYCETHVDEAMAVNARGSQNLATKSGELGAQFVFISTDFVFDGVGAPYTEESVPNPLSVYARSKLEGERLALEANPGKTIIVRPAVIYSWVSNSGATQSSSGKPLNFAAWLVSQLLAGKETKVVQDQVTSPTLASDLAGAILALLAGEKSGLFHAAGSSALSRYEFSVKVAAKLNLNKALIHPIESSELKQLAKRPSNSSLVSDKIKRELGYQMLDIDMALDVFARESRAGLTS